jgi:hypothetical protein
VLHSDGGFSYHGIPRAGGEPATRP